MNKILHIILIFLFGLTIFSCAKKEEEKDTTAPVIAEVYPVTTPTSDSSPNYTFSSTEAGTITYGGSCSSVTTSATSGNNTITFLTLSDGTYSDCTIIVTDSDGNASNTLAITSFIVNTTTDTTRPTVSSVSTTADNQSSVSITDNITVTFSEAMNTTYVTTSTSDTYCAGTIRVSSDNFSSCVRMSSEPVSSNSNRTFTLDPYDNLTGGTTYKTRVTTGVKDTAGNALSSQYETSSGFTTLLPAPDNLSASGANNTITLTWNSVSGATSYTLYWDNVPGIDSSDTAITSITNDNYTDSTKETNYALDFDGTDDYVAADGVTSNLDSSTGLPFTVSAWAYPDTAVSGTTACCSKREAIFAFNNSGANLNILYFAQDGSTQKFYHNGTGGNNYTGSSNTFESGQWHLIVMVADSSGNGKLYVNGGQEATWSNGTNTSVNKFSIGQEYDGTGSTATDFFDGKIDEVAIWNVALSTSDVTSLYNSGNGLKASANSGNYDNSADLIGYWKFNEGTGSTLTDSTSNSNNGTLTHMDSSDWVTSGFNLVD